MTGAQQMRERPERPEITVVGVGHQPATPSGAVLVFGVEVEGRTPAEALERLAASQDAVLRTVRAAGVPDRFVQTTAVSVQPQWDHHKVERPRVVGYQATSTLSVALDDVARAGSLAGDVLAAAGEAARLHELRPALGAHDAAEATAREAAFADARGKAEHYARLAGVTLGQVVAVRETGTDGHRPHPGAFAARLSAGPEISPGESDVAAAVIVTWELAD